MLKEEMTEQEVFDHVAKHLLTQNKKSEGTYRYSENGTEVSDCLYRGQDGLMCAAGCLISNDEYQPEMEGIPVMSSGPSTRFPKRIRDNSVIVSALQQIHDNSYVCDWKKKLSMLAEVKGLSSIILNDFT